MPDKAGKGMMSERGSLSIEAALCFVIFMFVCINLNYIVRITRVHAIMQHGLTETATEIAQYSYLFSAFGIKPYMDEISGTLSSKSELSRKAIGVAEDFTGYVAQTHDSVENLTSGGMSDAMQNASQLYHDVKEMAASGGEVIETAKEIARDPKSAILSLVAMVLEDGYEALKTEAATLIIRGLMEKHLSTAGYDSAARLRKLGVKNISFSKTTLFSDAKKENIDIVVTYEMEFPTPLKLFGKMRFMQRATVRAWL